MGLMDKVKAQATQLADKAQQAGQAGQAKLAEMQAKKKADALLLEMGGIVYGQKKGQADPNAEGRIGELVDHLKQHEAEHGPVAVTSANAALAEDSGVVDPTATVPSPAAAPAPAPAPAAAPPAASSGPMPQAQYGSSES